MTTGDPTHISRLQPCCKGAADCGPETSANDLFRALQASEARWRALIETTQDWVWEVDHEGRYTYASPRVREMLGYQPEEVLGKTPFDFMPELERERVLEAFSTYLEKRASFQGLENINRRKDGSLVVLETNGMPFFLENGEFGGYRGIDRDITQRKQAETALRRKTEELEAMLSNTHILVAVLDREFNFVRVNNRYADASYRTVESLIGRNHFEIHPDEENEKLFREVINTGNPCSVTAKACNYPDRSELGTTYWDWTLTPIKGEAGGVEGVVFTLVDVTERERQRQAAETAHLEAQAQLEQRVRERTAALEAANRELEAFSYAVSHDLRAPLRSINGFSTALQEDCPLNELGREYLQRIQSATLRMSELIDGLLGLSLIFRTELQTQLVDLSALAQDFFQHIRQADTGRVVDIHVEQNLTAFGDPALLRLLLQNLLGNAWKFTANCGEARISFTREAFKGGIGFVVRDNGVGFDMKNARKLFQPFERLHGREEFEGTGIGLATVRRIVERHAGEVWAEGNLNRGAAFFFTLGAFESPPHSLR